MFQLASVLALIAVAGGFNGDLLDEECPDDCDCYYFRINWVTDCSESNLTEIPYSELSPNVYILDLNGNYIKDIKPFPQNIKMRRLQLADNLISEIRTDSFLGLNYLIDADFSGNQIRKVDPDTFQHCSGLITLELQGNPLNPLKDGPFLSIKTLLYLDISNCSLSHLNPEFFTELRSLTTLDLSNNPLESINEKVFDSLSSLEILKLNDCNISRINVNAFRNLENLKTLELIGNMLGDIDWALVLTHLIRLENLDLSRANIKELPGDSLNNTAYLRLLKLSGNKLEDFDVASTIGHKLQHLDTLDLSHCNLRKALSEDAFANATKIRTLILSGNLLFASDLLVALSPLTKLHKLGLSDCGLRQLPDTFHKFKTLQELDISHNPLSEAFVKLISPLETLEYLNMGHSNLTHISSDIFSKMTSMKRLILSGNNLHFLESGLFANLTSLESLELNFCGLERPLNATLFFNNLTYTDLTELQLAGNPLHVSETGPLLPKQFSRLQTLNLSNCSLKFLSADAFYHTRNITTLILSGNQLTSPTEFSFLVYLPKLKVLDLRYNHLHHLARKYFENNPDIEKLRLVGNPWKCDCSIADMWDWALLIKRDLSILEGSKITDKDVTAGKEKRKKLLLCYYDVSKENLPQTPNNTVIGRRPFSNPGRVVTSNNRTWAKYVRESGCITEALYYNRETSPT